MPVEFIKRLTLLRMHHVVHADVLAEPVFFAEGVVAHADQFFAVELCSGTCANLSARGQLKQYV